MPATSVAVMGSTGSIGTQTLEVAAARSGDFEVVALGAARSVDLLAEQATTFRPAVVAIADPSLGAALADRGPIVPDELNALESGRSYPVNAGFWVALSAEPAPKIRKVHVGSVGEHPVEIGGHC